MVAAAALFRTSAASAVAPDWLGRTTSAATNAAEEGGGCRDHQDAAPDADWADLARLVFTVRCLGTGSGANPGHDFVAAAGEGGGRCGTDVATGFAEQLQVVHGRSPFHQVGRGSVGFERSRARFRRERTVPTGTPMAEAIPS